MKVKLHVNVAAIVGWVVLVYGCIGYYVKGWQVQDMAVVLAIALVIAVLANADRLE